MEWPSDIPDAWFPPTQLEALREHATRCAAVRNSRESMPFARWVRCLSALYTRRTELAADLLRHLLIELKRPGNSLSRLAELHRRRLEVQGLLIRSAGFLRVVLHVMPQHFDSLSVDRARIYVAEFHHDCPMANEVRLLNPADIDFAEFQA